MSSFVSRITSLTWTRRFSGRDQGHNTRCSRRAERGLVEGISGGWLSELGRRIEGFGTGEGREEGGCLEI
jgi:hypothetical protein